MLQDFLGSTICRQLVEKGEKVRAFVLPNDTSASFLPKEVEIIKGDLTDKNSLEQLFKVNEGEETICLIHFTEMYELDLINRNYIKREGIYI